MLGFLATDRPRSEELSDCKDVRVDRNLHWEYVSFSSFFLILLVLASSFRR